jgi:hypothetical protein
VGDERMMDIHDSIKKFIQQVEIVAGKKFFFPDEVLLLFEVMLKAEQQQTFNELLFHASAAVKTQDVMKRIGPGADGYEKLSTEFQSNAECVVELIRKMIQQTEHEQIFEKQFLAFESKSFSRLIQLCSDLRLIKNWEVDGKPFPTLETIAEQQSTKKEKNKTELHLLHQRTKRCVLLALVLLILLAFIDPPVTILGWCVTITVLGLLAYISFLIEEIWKRISGMK